ncbi:MAG: phytanoyl-CoA dioxygenase family protein, partial [Armatimonadota bacterium]|nr:phytanoyl-CoA dioxygenase family protein [Armatimonadota bacterium]
MNDQLTEDQWQQFEQDGYLRLGKVLTEEELAALQRRMDDIMLGTAEIDYTRTLMQRDSDTGQYGDVGPANRGFKGPTLNYRKIEDLEFDPLFLAYMQRPLFRHICERVYGSGTPITAFRAMFMNKPAGKGTFLPWHQDRWTDLDRDPLITIWTALDPATADNGCIQIINHSHRAGLINKEHPSGFVTPEQAQEVAAKNGVSHLEVPAGEAVLLHNWLLHSSDVNRTAIPRRAFS